MGSLPSKIIGVLLSFVLLILAPGIIVALKNDSVNSRKAQNAVKYYADIVCDKGLVTQPDYLEFVAKMGTTMNDYEITISVQRKQILPAGGSAYKINYVSIALWRTGVAGLAVIEKALEAGDCVQVVAKPLARTKANNLLTSVLGLHIPPQPITYASVVRNSGG